ncbi:kinase-like domain-containing protein [Rhizophagus clarus]|uniref:Kinase-like domain-containing protein n=1 Tax=Rhizophagus clarus TaxID=94130 RepID=A0A8H3LWC0_9GLOM|nr:kinase-like domain-containing protein [Rhizophagus clarus]
MFNNVEVTKIQMIGIEIGSGGFAKVYRANWKKSHIRYAIKSFIKIDNATAKAIVREIQLHREVDHHDNVISFYGVTTSIKENQRKEYSLVIEYADNVHAISCLHDEGIIHRDLHSKNVLVHQHAVKLSDFGLSKRIEETSSSSKTFGLIPYIDPKRFNRSATSLYLLNKKSDVYSIGILLWEISSGQPPFHGTPYDIDCWNIEPDNRPTINQVIDELKAIIIKENIIIKDFHLCDNNKDIQSSNDNPSDSDVKISENSYSFQGELFQVIQNFYKMNTKEIESLISSNNQIENSFNIIVNDIINILENNSNKIGKQKVLNYLNNQNITLQEINNLLLNNQNNSNYIFCLENLVI